MKWTIGIALVVVLMGAAAAEEITKLHGLNTKMKSKMYSGYITVDKKNDRRLFYFFVESQKAPSTDPLVLWLNGGPGCSSLYGTFTEHGPYRLNFTTGGHSLIDNPYSWATEANVIYLESPAGVGFSYSNVTSDYTTGDARTAADSMTFLLEFFKEFPQFKHNNFWVAGESYGGHYVPELTRAIYNANHKLNRSEMINLVGLMAGNPWTDPEVEAFEIIKYWWYHGIIGENTYHAIGRDCDYQGITYWIINNVSAALLKGPHYNVDRSALSPKCEKALHQASITEFGGVSILGIYYDRCFKGTRGDIPDQPNWCAFQELPTYLNIPQVQADLHARPTKWYPCAPDVHYNFNDTIKSVRWIYQELVDMTDLKILIFSGDNDAIVPLTASRKWVEGLKLPIVNGNHEWYADTNGEQVAGWATQYSRLTFTTVRDAGHMVAFRQPYRALKMFVTFIREGKL